MFKNNKGYTLFELMMVVALMTVISIGVLIDKRNEALQIQARVLGAEIAEFARGATSYVGYYSTMSPIDPTVPVDGQTFNGVNWLKSSLCMTQGNGNAPTSSAGANEIGFIDNCSFLSRVVPGTTTPAIADETTGFRNLEFTTTFHRSLFPGHPAGTPADTDYPAYSITELTPLIDDKGLNMHSLSGLAASLANGYGISDFEGGQNFKVLYCLSDSSSNNPLYNSLCPSRVGKIVIYASNDARSDIWLRTDGGNPMNAAITFNDSIAPDMQSIENLSKLVISNGSLTLESAANAMNSVSLSVGDAEFGANTLVLNGANLAVKGGKIDVEGEITADGRIASLQEIVGTRFNDSNTSNGDWYVDPDSDSRINTMELNQLKFDSTNTATEPTINASGDSMNLSANSVNFDSKTSSHAILSGDVDLSQMMVRMSNGSNQSLASLLPRMRLLDTIILGDYTATGNQVPISSFTSMGCAESNLRPIVTPVSWNTISALTLFVDEITISELNTNTTQVIHPLNSAKARENLGASHNVAYVDAVSGQYRVTVMSDSETTSIAHGSAARRGTGLLSVYCIQDVFGS